MARPCFKLEKGHPDLVAGVDEAGCAPLAGPVVAAAVILDREKFPRGIDDSKNLPAEKREAIYARLTRVAAWGVGIASVEEIDRLNIYWARMLAMERAVEDDGGGDDRAGERGAAGFVHARDRVGMALFEPEAGARHGGRDYSGTWAVASAERRWVRECCG